MAPATRSGEQGAESPRRDPERTRRAILRAARREFSTKGLEGARVDEIAARAKTNKRMLYHYYGSKDGLFLAVMEAAYAAIREHERGLSLDTLGPREAMEALVRETFDYFIRHPELIKLLNDENLHKARHVRRSKRIVEIHSPLVRLVADILEQGQSDGLFRADVDAVHLYISVASLSYFYLSNRYTLSVIFRRQIGAGADRDFRREHVVEVIMGYLRP